MHLIKPIKGNKYMLTYYEREHSRGRDIGSYEFTFMAMRGNKYYFFAERNGIDLVLNKYEFNKYLNNTIEKLLNK